MFMENNSFCGINKYRHTHSESPVAKLGPLYVIPDQKSAQVEVSL
jgi:hypothetical protein